MWLKVHMTSRVILTIRRDAGSSAYPHCLIVTIHTTLIQKVLCANRGIRLTYPFDVR